MRETNILALDVGEKRIGVALFRAASGLAKPLTTLLTNDKITEQIAEIVQKEVVKTVVVGLPRGLEGQETPQTKKVRDFATKLESYLGLDVQFMDEAVTSITAEAELKARGRPYNKSDIDALAACLILEDFVNAKNRNLN